MGVKTLLVADPETFGTREMIGSCHVEATGNRGRSDGNAPETPMIGDFTRRVRAQRWERVAKRKYMRIGLF
jgi:hypothetical protein